MSARSLVRRFALVAGLLLPCAGASAGGGGATAPPPPADEVGLEWDYDALRTATQAWMDAWRAQDAARLAQVAAQRNVDPVVMLTTLLSSHATGSLADPPEPKDFLPAAEAYAERQAGRRAAEGLPAILAAWRTYGRAEFEREQRLKEALAAVHAQVPRGRVAEALGSVDGVLGDVERSVSYRAGFLLLERANLLRRLGRGHEALAAWQAAAQHAQRVRWPHLEARALVRASIEAEDLGDLDAAVAHLERARDLHEALGEPGTMRHIEGMRALTLRDAARLPEALAGMERVRRLAQQSGRAGDAVAALTAQGGILARLGDVPEAVRRCEAAAAEAAAADLPVEAARALAQLASLLTDADRYAEALQANERALALAEPAHDASLLASIHTGRGVLYRRLRQPERALEAQRRAVAAADEGAHPLARAAALGNLGVVEAELGLPSASDTLRRALEAKRKAGDRLGALETLIALGNALGSRPPTREEGRRRLAEAVQVLRSARSPLRLATALNAQAGLEQLDGRVEAARALAQEALAILERVQESGLRTAQVRERLGALALEAGAPAEALEHAREALATRRRLLMGLGDEEAAQLAATARTPGDLGLEAARALAAQGAPGAAGSAFDLCEASRATLLASGLVNAAALLAASVPEALTREEAAARARLAAARRALLARASEPGGADPAADDAALREVRGALAAATEAHGAVVARIQRSAQRAAGVVWPEPLPASAVCGLLDRETALVLYHLTPYHGVAVVATCDGTALVDLGPAASLSAQAEAYARLVSTPGSDEAEPAAALYERLVRPLEPHLGARTRLIVSPDGLLAFLPFEALRRREGERAERLVERHEVVYAPSATAYVALRTEHGSAPRGRGFVGVGDPAPPPHGPPLPPLPSSAAEVRGIAARYPEAERTVLLGAQASWARLSAALPAPPGRLAALHLACHAFVNPEHPRLSVLVLAGDDPLDLDTLHRLRIPADLVVLSACATGKGRLLRGEGVLGFARGFFTAGVPRVVVSNWVIADDQAAALMLDVHARLRAGGGPAAALRAAKRQALAAGGAAAHPSAWAAFVLWGLPD